MAMERLCPNLKSCFFSVCYDRILKQARRCSPSLSVSEMDFYTGNLHFKRNFNNSVLNMTTDLSIVRLLQTLKRHCSITLMCILLLFNCSVAPFGFFFPTRKSLQSNVAKKITVAEIEPRSHAFAPCDRTLSVHDMNMQWCMSKFIL